MSNDVNAGQHHNQIIAWRRDLHANPELGYELPRTASFLAGIPRAFGYDEVAENAEVSRRLSFPTDGGFAWVTAGAAARCWTALDAGRTTAVMQHQPGERGCRLGQHHRPVGDSIEKTQQGKLQAWSYVRRQQAPGQRRPGEALT